MEKSLELLILTGSISRQGGGLFDAVRRPAKILARYQDTFVRVFSVHDRFSEIDNNSWDPITPVVFKPVIQSNFGYAPKMKIRLINNSPDILHEHGLWMYQSFVTEQYCSKTRVPYVISPHGMLDHWALKNSKWKKKLAGVLYENRNLNRASCLHALNQAEMLSIREYGLKNPICLIPNGIDIPDFQESLKPPWWNLVEPGKKVLLFLGRIHPKKGLMALLKAWGKLVHDDVTSVREWNLVIVGWNQEGHEEDLRKICKTMCVEKSVCFLGPLFDEQKTAAYQNADAFILPSFSEGLPMTILEAWAHKLPVVMTPQCNLPEGFSANAAIPIQPSTQAIIPGLIELFDMTNAELIEMGRNGFILVGEKFSWEKITANLFSVYNWILGGGAPPSCIMTD